MGTSVLRAIWFVVTRRQPGMGFLLLLLALMLLVGCRRDRDEGASEIASGGSVVEAKAVGATDSVTVMEFRPESGVRRGSMQIGGYNREWRLYVPESLSASGDVPLVVGLHGGLGSGEQFAEEYHFDEQAERGGFIAVYPDGIGRRVVAARTWNGGGCCGYAMGQGVDDVGFLVALVEELSVDLPIDPERIYATGHSNGAIMSYRLACERADLFAAIAVYAGALEVECEPSEPVSVLAIHGDADQNIPIGGGVGPRAITDTEYHSLEYTIRSWVASNGCDAQPEVSVVGAVTTSTWGGCDDGVVVETQVVVAASHSWPGGAPTGPLRPDPSGDLDASAAVWDFLSLRAR